MKPIVYVAVKNALGGSVMADYTQSPECLTARRSARREGG
jgi:hypothetical protein